MNDIILTGSVDSALAHLCLVGAAAIVESSGGDPVRFYWREGEAPAPVLVGVGSWEQLAQAVLKHAASRADDSSWLMRDASANVWSGARLFAARSKPPPDPSEWRAVHEQRAQARPIGPASWQDLDETFLQGLGEPAWWRHGRPGQPGGPDDGASRWEMTTRNLGKEFLRHRLGPLAVVMANRSVASVAAGLAGDQLIDELGKNSTNSRTSTGLAPPGPVDSTVAWCALWGLSVLPVRRRLGGLSGTAGMFPTAKPNPESAVLPVFTSPTTVSRYRSLVDSKKFATFALQADDVTRPSVEEQWLTEQGVRAVAKFPVTHSTVKVPERTVMQGQVTALWT